MLGNQAPRACLKADIPIKAMSSLALAVNYADCLFVDLMFSTPYSSPNHYPIQSQQPITAQINYPVSLNTLQQPG